MSASPTKTCKEKSENLKQFNILLTSSFSAFSPIVDGLFLTGVGGMSLENFRKNKINLIINCTNEAPNWRLSGVECFRIPVNDSPTEDLLAHLDHGADKIASTIEKGGRVVVHCVAGVSRSAAVVIAFLIKHKGMNLHDAFNHVHSRRRVIRPNNGFFKQLIAYENKILGKNSVKMVTLKRDDVEIEVPDFFETEHRKFVLLETFKAKAHTLKTPKSTTGSSSLIDGRPNNTGRTPNQSGPGGAPKAGPSMGPTAKPS